MGAAQTRHGFGTRDSDYLENKLREAKHPRVVRDRQLPGIYMRFLGWHWRESWRKLAYGVGKGLGV